MNRIDTIAAIATAPGRASVGIIRISGPEVPTLMQVITGQKLSPRYAHYCDFFNPQGNNKHNNTRPNEFRTNNTKHNNTKHKDIKPNNVIDQGLALFFPNPHSFTGEDVLELQGHGGPVVLDHLLNAIISVDNIRLAKPGEFSERAYLNDKIDLTQAEAIADLINATSEQAARNAVHSLQGIFSQQIHHLVKELTHLRMYIEAAIDFPEEEINFLNNQTLFEGIQELKHTLEQLSKEAKQGLILKEGMTAVIAGKPNAGKSSLLNALARKESAIVTDIPGTTRDTLREHIHLDGMPLHIIDTAGLRESGDTIEKMGMERAWSEIEKADRILLLIDATEVIDATKVINTKEAIERKENEQKIDLNELIPLFSRKASEQAIDYSKITLVYNKADLLDKPDTLLEQQFTQQIKQKKIPQLLLSAKTGKGIDSLRDHLKSIIGYEQLNESGFTARRRHLDALASAQQHIEHAYLQLQNEAGELVAEELRQAQAKLGEITGQVTSDELLGKIFSSFCIGK